MKTLTHTLDWEVLVKPVKVQGKSLGTKKALIRSDDRTLMGIRSKDYYPFFNRDLEALCQRLVEHTGFELKGFQEFQKGKRILAFLANPNKNLRICGEKVQDYLILGNSHDTSSKLFVGTSNYMIRCQNQFSEKIRCFERLHNRPIRPEEIQIEEILSIYERGRQNLYAKMHHLQDREASYALIRHLAQHLLGTLDQTDRLEMAPPRKRKQMALLLRCIETEIRALGPTLWGVFNGVTRYTSNHLKGNQGFGVVNGLGERMNREAMEMLKNIS